MPVPVPVCGVIRPSPDVPTLHPSLLLHPCTPSCLLLRGGLSTNGDTSDVTNFGHLSPCWGRLFDDTVAQATHVPTDNTNKFVPFTKLDWKQIFFGLEWLSVSGVNRNRLPQKRPPKFWGFITVKKGKKNSISEEPVLSCDPCSQSDIHPPASDSSLLLSEELGKS